jgi:hypothetical protein
VLPNSASSLLYSSSPEDAHTEDSSSQAVADPVAALVGWGGAALVPIAPAPAPDCGSLTICYYIGLVTTLELEWPQSSPQSEPQLFFLRLRLFAPIRYTPVFSMTVRKPLAST